VPSDAPDNKQVPWPERRLRLKKLHLLHSGVEEVAFGSFRRKRPPEIVGSGYLVKSLEAALWAFHDAQDFREAVLWAVNLADDADTTGAVCGQLAGAYPWRTRMSRPSNSWHPPLRRG
jgi:ADP-ribosyl-[dinitrogen reductase] hydrolase